MKTREQRVQAAIKVIRTQKQYADRIASGDLSEGDVYLMAVQRVDKQDREALEAAGQAVDDRLFSPPIPRRELFGALGRDEGMHLFGDEVWFVGNRRGDDEEVDALSEGAPARMYAVYAERVAGQLKRIIIDVSDPAPL